MTSRPEPRASLGVRSNTPPTSRHVGTQGPANPPTKRPLVALIKQARAFGVGVLVATQNPMDLDYRALGNAGIWCVGRLQTDADCVRVVDGLASSEAASRDSAKTLAATVKRLAPRWFVMRDAHMDAARFCCSRGGRCRSCAAR